MQAKTVRGKEKNSTLTNLQLSVPPPQHGVKLFAPLITI